MDTVNECLWRDRGDEDDDRICLTPKAFAVLRFLVEHAGNLVTEDELLAAAWPRVCVQPEAIKTRIHEIRKVLGDDSKNSRFIETLPRRGYRFIAPVSDAFVATAGAVESPSPKLVGREMQLEELSVCLKRAIVSRREIVFITGETGIGKTTLADAFTRRAAIEISGMRIARGQCLDGHGAKEPYYPVLEAIGQLCRASDGATLVRILSTLAPTWLVQFPDLVAREQRERFHQEILGATRGRMLREIIEALEAFSSERPLLLVLEDLHWADPFTVDFISSLARRRGTGKLMLVATYRPVDITVPQHPLNMVKQDLLVHQLCREIALNPLTEAQVGEYMALEAAGAPAPAGVAALIYRHSDGNPLFMVAALDHMIHRNLIAVENGVWRLKVPLESIDMRAPESLRQMIELQIERLSAEEQRVLEIASVTGVSFTLQANALGTTVSEEEFQGVCEDLARRQLMLRRANHFQDGAISDRYEFVHVLYRNVFYHRQASAHRARLERRISEQAAEARSHP
ncbi:MAG TPA: AAA family ATPase [Steroidobacteraceae bacterium]|nr:AAA family ATPase [Steroidobacteraceae bacterium]